MKYRKVTWKKWNIVLYESVILRWRFEISLGQNMIDDLPVFVIIVYKYGLAIWRWKNDTDMD